MTEGSGGPLFMPPGDALRVVSPVGGEVTYHARGEQTGGSLTAISAVAGPGDGPPLHRHLDEDELIFVLDGRMRVRLEDEVHEALPGSFAFVPKRLPHAWQNIGAEPARFLFVFTPAAVGMERFFERSAQLPEESRLAEAFGTLAADAGMEVLGPPLAESHPLG
jgi:quercetin dioxygenase-like cupin family protein